jgi:tetratricopeptide (TPR) repeat protein
LLALAGAHASTLGDYEGANEKLTEAVALAREHDDDRILGLALYSLATHHFNYEEYQEAIDVGTESIELLRRVGDLWNLANVLGYVSASNTWLARIDESATYGAEAETLALKLGNWSAWVWGQRGRTYAEFLETLDFDWYEEDGRKAVELGQQQNYDWVAALGYSRMGLAAFWAGRWDESLKHNQAAADLNVRGAHGGYMSRLYLAHAYLGNRKEALSLIEECRPQFAVAGRPNRSLSYLLALGAIEALAVLGEREAAAALYPIAAHTIGMQRKARGIDHRLMDTLAGIAAGCAGEWDTAERHFEAAVALAKDIPYRIEEADAYRFHAQMLMDRCAPGDSARARELLDQAIVCYQRNGMQRHEKLAREMLDQIA